jgi:UDP-glucose:(heptosyl)LPS alpha-1,3-glucosyltransferase
MIVAISKRGKDEIIRHYGTQAEKIRVVYNAIDTNRFDLPDHEKIRNEVRRSLGISQNAPVLLFVGSGFQRKGLPFAIKALARLDAEVRLIVIGHDRMNPYRALAKKEGVEKRVIFLGPLADVEKYYCASDLFIFPTIYEPFGNVCLEAMAAGIPLVTSRICGGSELLDESKNGYIIDDPTNPVEIADGIRKGLTLKKQDVFDFNGHVLQNYSWKRYLEEMSIIYEELQKKNF